MPALKQFQPAIRKEEQQSDRFLDYFYKRCAGELYNPLLHNVPEHKNVTCMSNRISLFLFTDCRCF